MKRRAFVVGISSVFIAAPLMVRAQPPRKVYRIGHLMLLPRARLTVLINALEEGLRGLGYIDGENIIIEHRSAEGQSERLAGVAADLVHLKVDVIVAGVNPGIAAAKHATSTIPIVMVYGADPVGAGFITNLARPGGNVTGGTWDPSAELLGKLLELSRETVPHVQRVAMLWDPAYVGTAYLTSTATAAERLGVKVDRVDVSGPDDIERAFDSFRRDHAGALVVAPGPALFYQRERIVSLVAGRRLPTIYPFREYVDAGGLLSYGPDLRQAWRRAAVYVDRILKGAKPADLPVEQPTKFELVINLKTAKALGLTIPPSLLARADQVIE